MLEMRDRVADILFHLVGYCSSLHEKAIPFQPDELEDGSMGAHREDSYGQACGCVG